MLSTVIAVELLLLIPFKEALQCFDCPDIDDPRRCSTTATCDTAMGQDACFVREMEDNSLQFRYQLGCGSSKDCDTGSTQTITVGRREGRNVTRRDFDSCHRCCQQDLCNALQCEELCVGSPCQNGATCLGSRFHQLFLCLCPPAFTGRHCERSLG